MRELVSALERFAKVAAKEGIVTKTEPAKAAPAPVPATIIGEKRKPGRPRKEKPEEDVEEALSRAEGELTMENLDKLEASIKAFPGRSKERPVQKAAPPVRAAPVSPPKPAAPPTAIPTAAARLEIPKGSLARLGPRSITAQPAAPAARPLPAVPAADTRALAKVPPSEAKPFEERVSKMTLNEIDNYLSLVKPIPWQTELVRAELEHRKAEQMQKKYANKPVIEILLDVGEVPHNLLKKEPAWAEGSKETIDEGVKNIDVRLIRALSDYYNRIEGRGDLNDNEKYAAKAMRDRIWDDEIGTYSVDEMPLLPEDMDKLRDMQIPLLSGFLVSPLELSNRELAEALYVKEGGGATFGDFKNGPFDRESKERSPLIDDIKVRFEGSAYTLNNPAAPVERIETPLASKALFKRLLFGRYVPIKELKDRKGKAELVEAEAMAYMPPIYDELKVYYKPEFKTIEISDAKELLFKMNPEELHKTYQLYYIMKAKNMLDKREEYLEHEMEELLEKFEKMNVISGISRPRTRPPPKITDEDFTNYLAVVNGIFGELPEEAVKGLMKRPDEEKLFWVLTTGIANDEEKKHFVNVMDDLMVEALPAEKMDEFFKTPEGKLYYKVFQKYGEM